MRLQSGQVTTTVRLLALLCLTLLVVAGLAGPLHKHDSHEGATCLICHVTQRANVASVAQDAGKPYLAAVPEQLCTFHSAARTEAPDSTRASRAPPTNSFSL